MRVWAGSDPFPNTPGRRWGTPRTQNINTSNSAATGWRCFGGRRSRDARARGDLRAPARVTGEEPRSLCCSSALISTSDINPQLRTWRHLHRLRACNGAEGPARVEAPINGGGTAESHPWHCKGFPRKAAHQFWAAGAGRHQFLELSLAAGAAARISLAIQPFLQVSLHVKLFRVTSSCCKSQDPPRIWAPKPLVLRCDRGMIQASVAVPPSPRCAGMHLE